MLVNGHISLAQSKFYKKYIASFSFVGQEAANSTWRIYIYIYIYIYNMCVCVFVCVYVCLCACACVVLTSNVLIPVWIILNIRWYSLANDRFTYQSIMHVMNTIALICVAWEHVMRVLSYNFTITGMYIPYQMQADGRNLFSNNSLSNHCYSC